MIFLVNKSLNEGASLSISIVSVCLTHCMLQDCPINQPFIQLLRRACFNWRVSDASETLSGVYKFELVRYIYICVEVHMQ